MNQKKVVSNIEKLRNMSLRETAESRIQWCYGGDNGPDYYEGDFGKKEINPPYAQEDMQLAYIQALELEMKWLLAPAKEDDK